MFGGIDILLCFAGITDSKLAVEYPIEQWRRIFDVNVHGSFLVARAVARFVESFTYLCTSHFVQSHGRIIPGIPSPVTHEVVAQDLIS